MSSFYTATILSQLTQGIIATSRSSLSYSLCGRYQFCLSKPCGGGGPGAVSAKTILSVGFLIYSHSMISIIYRRMGAEHLPSKRSIHHLSSFYVFPLFSLYIFSVSHPFIDPVFPITSPKPSFSMNDKRAF